MSDPSRSSAQPDESLEPVFHQRALKWRIRTRDVVLFLDLPGAGADAFFDVLAGFFPPDDVRVSRRWPRNAADLASIGGELQGGRLLRASVDYEFYRFLSRPPAYVTLLRDPVERVVALYDHVRRTPAHPYHEPVTSRQMSLHDFVCEPAFAPDVVDVQARRVAGGMFREPRPADRVLLLMAQANLGELAFFGLADRMSQSLNLLLYTFGWPFPRELDLQWLAPPAAGREGVAPATLEAIEARTRVDHALVQFAREQLEHRVRTALLDLLEQNARLSGPLLTVLRDYERIQKEHELEKQTWSWRTMDTLKTWRQALLPRGSRRGRLYQRVGTLMFHRGKPAS